MRFWLWTALCSEPIRKAVTGPARYMVLLGVLVHVSVSQYYICELVKWLFLLSDYVNNDPGAFTNAYFDFASLNIYIWIEKKRKETKKMQTHALTSNIRCISLDSYLESSWFCCDWANSRILSSFLCHKVLAAWNRNRNFKNPSQQCHRLPTPGQLSSDTIVSRRRGYFSNYSAVQAAEMFGKYGW